MYNHYLDKWGRILVHLIIIFHPSHYNAPASLIPLPQLGVISGQFDTR